ncbi:MAG: (Fe-S)-binding protein [Bacillota bacterium]|jgi:glycolate oxidase iron-sulfur subunit
MSYEEHLEDILQRCNRCGECQSVCPVYKELGVESGVARGKISLVKALREGEMDWTPGIVKKMDICLQCKRCSGNCPGGSEGDTIIRWGRTEAQKRMGVPLIYRLIARMLLPRRWIFNSALGMGKFGQKVLFRKGPNGQGMLPRIPFGIDMRRVISPLASKTLKQRLPELNTVDKPVKRAVYFTGCMANFIYPQVGESLVRVLNKNNVEVIIPSLQHCCGMPVYASGDMETARIMAKENLKVLGSIETDAIVVSCGSCGLALKEHYPELFADDPEMEKIAHQVAGKVKDISEVIIGLEYADEMKRVDKKVTYHDPCHLKIGLKVTSEPRQILKSIPGVSFLETGHSLCCGSGGSFSLKHYDLSTKITNRCVKELAATGAEVVATGCLACRMQLEDTIAQNGITLKVRHTVELLDQSYQDVKHE